VRVLLVSTYELGHQPLHVASPAAALREAGHDVRLIDISVETWDADLVDWAHAVAFSVPMHTATRLALAAAASARRRRPGLPVCFYGLYAAAAEGAADHVVAGEYEPALVEWVSSLAGGAAAPGGVRLERRRARLPVRADLPGIERYARLSAGGEERPAGYVEASRGCAHRCRHCPVPVVYDGRTRKVPIDVVLDDAAQQIDAGARHITFGDPDFLNRWAHSMQVVDEFHRRFPDVTYDVTAKVSHLIAYEHLLDDLARTGCLFVVSAFECVNDEILRYLDKGHTAEDAARATSILRERAIEVRPSWLPFTPWTTVRDVVDILDFVAGNGLAGNVDPVQYTIKLLIPPGSLMLRIPELEPYLGAYDPENLTYTWRAADERTVQLQRELTGLVTAGGGFAEVYRAALDAAGDAREVPHVAIDAKPRLTEPWFCCAEPTDAQFDAVR
jgi:radical SAM superfamily enzyme YgiQ (UPF0313 family)